MALIDKASLLMVPSTYEEGTLYNVLPSGNRAPDSTDQNSGYDQTRADFSFDRGSNAAATRIGSDGLIKKYRENLLTESNIFSDSDWDEQNATLTSGQVDKDGGTDAWKLQATTTGQTYIQQYISIAANQPTALSIYAKKGNVDFLKFIFACSGSNSIVTFDLSDGSTSSNLRNISVNTEDVGGGWFRCSASAAPGTNITAARFEVRSVKSDADADAGSFIYIQNAQLETGLVATDVLTSGATTGKAGVLIDLPRINYDANGENGALLLEPSRQQLLQYSEYFSASGVWLPNTITIADNYGTSPEGLSNSTRLVLGNLTASRIAYAPTLTNGTTYTFSCYYKGTAGEKLYMEGNGSGGSGTQTSKLITLTGDWQREDLQFVGGSSSNLIYVVDSRNGTEDTATDFEVYGAQVEAGSYPTSYIPNHGTSGGVTRAADTMTLSNLQVNNLLGSNQGSFVFHYKPYNAYTGSSGEIFDFRIDANNRVATYLSSGTLRLFSNIAGSTNFNQATTLDGDSEFKIALAFDTNSTLVYINGSLEYTLNGFALGLTDFDILPPPNGSKLSQCSWYPTKLSGAELATLTTL